MIRSSFSDSSRDVAMATNFVSQLTCLLGVEVPQDPLDRFSQSLHHMVDIELQMNDTSSFFRYLRDVAMATNLVAKIGQNYLPPLHLSLCHSETEWHIALQIRAFIATLIALHRVKRW